jgi:DNA polymerase
MLSNLRAGDRLPAGYGYSTVLPEIDFESYSEAGFRWIYVPEYQEITPGLWRPLKRVVKKTRPGEIIDATGCWIWTPEKTITVPATQELASLEGMPSTKRGLPAVGVYNYVQHPTFELLNLTYNLKDGYGPRFWRPGLPESILHPLFDWVTRFRGEQQTELVQPPESDAVGLLEAWNSFFEETVWWKYCTPKLGWPVIHPHQWRDAMAKAARFKFPRALDNCGDVVLSPHESHLKKDKVGKDLIRKLTVPKNPTKANPALRWTRELAPEDFARFDAYNVQDTISESVISSRIPDLCPRELEIWQTHQAINHRGMYIDRPGVENMIAVAEQAFEREHGRLAAITHGAATKGSEVAKIVEWMRTQGVYLPNLDEEIVEQELQRPHPDNIKQVLLIRQRTAFSSVKKLYSIRAQVCADGRLRDQYAFAAAATDLWNGQNVQMANLYKPSELWAQKPALMEQAFSAVASRSLEYFEGVYGNALEAIANMLRSVVVAAPGNRLIMSDFTAIQAVVCAGLAGEEWRLEVFRTHGKIYEMCASMITGKPFEFYLDYKKTNGVHHEDRNPYGKIPELSAQFAAWINGWKKFGAGDFMTDDQIKAAILKWRAKCPMIVELWGGQTRNKFGRDLNGNRANEYPELYGLEGAAISAVLNPGTCYAYRGIRYLAHNDVLYCQPPGDCSPLIYHEPRLQPSTRPYASPWELELSYMGWNSNQTKGAGGWVRMDLYGGALTQNVVAKVSREYQADGMVRCERSGLYLPVMHTHDEIVTEVPVGRGSTKEYLGLINVPRAGGYDDQGRPWPIKAPGAEDEYRYGKWE